MDGAPRSVQFQDEPLMNPCTDQRLTWKGSIPTDSPLQKLAFSKPEIGERKYLMA